MLRAPVRDHAGCRRTIEHHLEFDASIQQHRRARQLGGHDTHGVQDVAVTGVRKVLGFGQRRYGNRAGVAIGQQRRDVQRFGGLYMRSQVDVERCKRRVQSRDVVSQFRPVDDGAGGEVRQQRFVTWVNGHSICSHPIR